MPDLPQDPMARLEAEVLRLRERSAKLHKELTQARADIRKRRSQVKTHGKAPPPSAGETV